MEDKLIEKQRKSKQYRETHKEQIKEYRKKYNARPEVKEKKRQYMRAWYNKHKSLNDESYKKYVNNIRKYQKNHPEYMREQNRKSRSRRGEQAKQYQREYMRKYRSENRNNIQEKEKEWYKARKQNDIQSKNKPCVYIFVCKKTNKCYLAKSINYMKSVNKLLYKLRQNKCNNIQLQQDFNSYGEEYFGHAIAWSCMTKQEMNEIFVLCKWYFGMNYKLYNNGWEDMSFEKFKVKWMQVRRKYK